MLKILVRWILHKTLNRLYEGNTYITTSHNSRARIHPFEIQHPKKWFPILWNCARQQFVSCTSNSLGQMFCFQKYIRFHPKLILSPQSRQQNVGFGINPIDNAEPCFPHDNVVGSHLCDECMKSNEQAFCHKSESILWLISQAYSLTRKCWVYQFVPSTCISRHFLSTLLTILQLIQVPLAWNGDHPSKALRLWTTALSFCSPVRNISPRIIEHVLPCRRTTQPFWNKKFFPPWSLFSCSSRNSWFEHFLCTRQ